MMVMRNAVINVNVAHGGIQQTIKDNKMRVYVLKYNRKGLPRFHFMRRKGFYTITIKNYLICFAKNLNWSWKGFVFDMELKTDNRQ